MEQAVQTGSATDTRSATDPRTTRCPHCGGLNAPEAHWCGQCFARFVEPAPPPPPSAGGDDPGIGDMVIKAAVGVGSKIAEFHYTADAPLIEQTFRIGDGTVTWKCASCKLDNPFEHSKCQFCGEDFKLSTKQMATKQIHAQRLKGEGADLLLDVATSFGPWAMILWPLRMIVSLLMRLFRR